jgi:hypothetical protein
MELTWDWGPKLHCRTLCVAARCLEILPRDNRRTKRAILFSRLPAMPRHRLCGSVIWRYLSGNGPMAAFL